MTLNGSLLDTHLFPRALARKLIPLLFLTATALQGMAATTVVRMVNFAFQQQSVTINVGDTVRWTNTTGTGHNVVSSTGAWTSPPLFTSPGTFSVTFTTPGTYNYFCAPHQSFGMTGVVTVQGAANQPPTVTLNSPQTGATLAAPATFTLGATASDPDGTVTNVQFFSGANLLGNDTSNPYSLTVNNLAAGTYNFTARAIDNLGLSRTSGVVTVSVVNPGPIRFDSKVVLSQGTLRFDVTATPGLSYALEYTTNFVDWQPWTSFVATNAVMSFGAPTDGASRRLFRAKLLPN